MPNRFFRYELRTTDLEAPRAFYEGVLGPAFWESNVSVSQLPARAAAQGAPCHWLAHLGVPDVEGMVSRMLAAGSQRLGPPPSDAGPSPVVLRDPFGSIVAVRPLEILERPLSPVAWHVLQSRDHIQAFAFYGGLFGWTATGVVDLGPTMGIHQNFSWDDSGRDAGSVANSASLPGVHPHWLLCFRTVDIQASLRQVRALGGNGTDPQRIPNDALVSACHDPQGAAFALHQSTRQDMPRHRPEER